MTNNWSRRLTASVLAALAVALLAFAVNMLAYLLVDQFQLAALGSIANGFWQVDLFALVFIVLAALFGLLRVWWLALISGVVSAALAVLLSGVAQLGSQAFGYLPTLAGLYLFFMVAVAVATPLLGRRVYRAALAWRRSRGRIALVRVPAATLAEALTSRSGVAIDATRADEQWDAYLGALVAAGWQTVEVEPADRLADGVFVEDTAVVLGDRLALITRPGEPSRRAETVSVADALRAQGITLYEIEEPGTLDGGDVLTVGDTVYVGRSARTNAEGIRQLRELVGELSLPLTVVAVPLRSAAESGALHLKSAATALPDGTVLVRAEALAGASPFARSLAVSEPSGANVVALAPDTVLVPASAPKTAELVADLGYKVVTVDLAEFEKLDGSATCLSILLA